MRIIHLVLSQILFSVVGVWASCNVFKHSLAFVWFISSIAQWTAWVEILKRALEMYWWSFSLHILVLQALTVSAGMLWRAVSDLVTHGSGNEVLCLWRVLILFMIRFLKISSYNKFFWACLQSSNFEKFPWHPSSSDAAFFGLVLELHLQLSAESSVLVLALQIWAAWHPVSAVESCGYVLKLLSNLFKEEERKPMQKGFLQKGDVSSVWDYLNCESVSGLKSSWRATLVADCIGRVSSVLLHFHWCVNSLPSFSTAVLSPVLFINNLPLNSVSGV